MLSARFIKKPGLPGATGGAAHDSKQSPVFRFLDHYYTLMLKWAMAHRLAMVGLSLLVMVSVVPLFMVVGKNFLPADDQSQFNVLVRTPEGSTLAATTNVAENIARELRKMPGVQNTLMTDGGGADQAVNSASIYVKLTDTDKRQESQQDLMVRTRKLLKSYPKEIKASVELVSSVGGNQSNAEVQYMIAGPDLKKLAEYSGKLQEKIRTIPDLVDLDSTFRVGKPELRVEINREKAADLGVQVGDIAQALNVLVAGQVASNFNAGEDQYDVRARAVGEYRASVEGLKRMTVASSKMGAVALDELVIIRQGTGPASINRANRQRQVTLTGNIAPGGSQAAVLQTIGTEVAALDMDAGYRTGLAGASKELGRTGYYFVLAFSLTFIFMYIVLAAQFESFIHPFTILLTLPLAVPFGIIALILAHQTVNIFSGLGLLLLFGIVKKNAILQIDHTNGLRAAGMPRYEAIIQANRDRLRPILMTTIALVAGMIPLVVSSGTGSATNRSIGVLVVGGQTLCLLLTLLAVPVFYSVFEDIGQMEWLKRLVRLRQERTA
jgi:HAE1 family hydrophobic/amphiphilic exporter-1